MLRIRPKDECRQDGIDKAAPDGDAGHIVFCAVVVANENDVADHVDEAKEHIKGGKSQSDDFGGCGTGQLVFSRAGEEVCAEVVDYGYLDWGC